MIQKFSELSLTVLLVLQTSCVAARKSTFASDRPTVQESKSHSALQTTKWPAVSNQAPFPLLQNASGAGVAQFTVLLPKQVKKRNITARRLGPAENEGIKAKAEIYQNYDLISTPESTPYVEEESKESSTIEQAEQISKAKKKEHEQWILLKFRFSGLETNIRYELEIDTDYGKDVRSFFIPNVQDGKIKFAYGSCMNDETPYIEAAQKFVSELEKNLPDMLIISGDAVYVDSWQRWEKEEDKQAGRPTYNPRARLPLHDFELRYFETWQRLPLYRMKQLIPTLAVWDDHDFGINDGGKDFKFESISREVHHLFYGANDIKGSYSEPATMGRASVFDSDGYRFIFSDNRYARKHESKDGAEVWKLSDADRMNYQMQLTELETTRHRKRSEYTIFGSKQTNWILNQLSSGQQSFTWLVVGNQAFGNHHRKESLSAYNTGDFLNFIAEMISIGKPFAILSGDIHASEVAKISLAVETGKNASKQRTFDILEFAVSPFHSTIKSKNDLYGTPLLESENSYRLRCTEGFTPASNQEALRASPPPCVVAQTSGQIAREKIAEQGLGMTGHNFALFESANTSQKKIRFKLISLIQNAEIVADIKLPDPASSSTSEILK